MTDIENKDAFNSLISEIQTVNADKELHWLISSIITPEFPQIIEALEICSNLLLYNSPQHPDPENRIERGPAIKLPLSTSKSEILKGVIVRDGAYITQLSVILKEPNFNKILHKLNLKKPVLLSQIIMAKKSIDLAIKLIKESSTAFIEECSQTDHDKLIKIFLDLLSEIQIAKNCLQLPTDPNLVFPINVTSVDCFEPEITPNISIDMYISQAELCIDLKKLHIMHEKPWSDIDDSGQSYVDKLREEMKLPSTHTSITPASTPMYPSQPLNMADIEQRLNQLASSARDSQSYEGHHSLINNVLSHLSLKPRHDPIDYITKCITYNNMVVMINKKIEVSSPDPVLVSAFTKLDSIEYLVGSFLENVQNIMKSLSI